MSDNQQDIPIIIPEGRDQVYVPPYVFHARIAELEEENRRQRETITRLNDELITSAGLYTKRLHQVRDLQATLDNLAYRMVAALEVGRVTLEQVRQWAQVAAAATPTPGELAAIEEYEKERAA